MQITSSTALVFKYLALPMGLGGRGGVERFFLLSQDIPFKEELYSGDAWTTEKSSLDHAARTLNPIFLFATPPLYSTLAYQ